MTKRLKSCQVSAKSGQTAEASKTKDAGAAGALRGLAASQHFQQKVDAEDAKLRAKAGLTQAEADKLQKLVGDIATQRLMWRKSGQGTLTTMQAELDKQLQGAPPDKRAEMQAAMAEMTASLTAMRDLTDVRKQYGDGLVNAVLQHEEEVVSLSEQQLKLLSEAR